MAIVGYLMITNVPPSTWLGTITEETQTVGRATKNGVVIPGMYVSVSRQHLQTRVHRETILIQDLNSRGGTLINGVSLTPGKETEVVFGDRIQLAGLEMVVVSPQAEVLKQPGSPYDLTVAPESSILLAGIGKQDTREGRRLKKLSPAELQVVCWVSRGLTTCEEIGARLYRSPHTIRTQLNHIYRKLHVHSRDELMAWLTRNAFSWAAGGESIHDDDSDISGLDRDAVMPNA